MKALRFSAVLLAAAPAISCSTAVSTPPPSAEPETSVGRFLDAVKANDLNAMMQLWGTSSGLAARQLGESVARQRLTVIRIYLEHEEYAITVAPMNAVFTVREGERVVFVRLNRKGCTPVVPFYLAPYRGSWLVRDVNLELAGNPARWCR